VDTPIFAGVHGGEQVTVDYGTNVVWVDIQGIVGVGSGSTSTYVSTGIVDEYINMTEYFQGLAHKFFSLHRIGQIGGKKGGSTAKGTNLLCHRWS
jgi:hypothetical protein